jgi:hypothetical protein
MRSNQQSERKKRVAMWILENLVVNRKSLKTKNSQFLKEKGVQKI